MERAVFQALKNRFYANRVLKTVGRDLLLGFEEERKNVVRPYTEVNLTQTGSYNTFDADVDQWRCDFRFHAKDMKSEAAESWLEAMRAAYKDANITSPEFYCAGMSTIDSSGPTMNDGVFDAKRSFQLIAQRKVRNPVVVRT
jgi:hypothetical protein